MLSRVALVSAGRLMFTGRRRDMLPYFALVQYPCPAYKNPSDYYLDLVTLDDLSAEAMLESSQRIEQLAETFRRHQEPLSDPGPPIALPYKIKRANCLSQMIALLMRALVYTQPVSLLCWLANVLLAVAMSLIVGAIFWDLPGSDPHLVLGDRLGFHYTMTLIAPWPLWLRMSLGEVGKERWAVDHDVRDRLYCRPAYIFTKGLLEMLERSVGVRKSSGCSRDRRRWVYGWSIVWLPLSSLGSSVGWPCRRGGLLASDLGNIPMARAVAVGEGGGVERRLPPTPRAEKVERCKDHQDVNQLYEDTKIVDSNKMSEAIKVSSTSILRMSLMRQLVYNLPASALIWMAYIIPAYCMSGLYLQGDETLAIYIYTGFMVLYLLANQMFLTALGYALKHRHVAAILAGLLLSSLTLVSGLPLHLLDVGVCCQWLGTVSPARWILPVLLQREYSPLALSSSTSSLTCKNKHFGVQHQDIIVQGSCLPPNGTAVLQFVHFLPDPRQPEYMDSGSCAT
uniref:ABC-2 type transporter transmembrane domain-containing protein n=1 Tax=Timema cristinae TaxID=61476 RepID=A0A7R9HAQ8_TIMCR|nr:unnamed protein product [Timema cristinae]